MTTNHYQVIRGTFPQVWRTPEGFMVSARSRKWGLNIRKTFPTEKEALSYRGQLEASIKEHGAQPNIPKDKLAFVSAYERLIERLTPFAKKPEDAVDHYVQFLGDEIARQAMPTVRHLVDQWQTNKLLDSTLDSQYRNEIKLHCRFIKRKFGEYRADQIRKNDIDTTLKKHPGSNNTRRKYLTFIRMFFNWLLAEDRGYVVTNPAKGIRFKADKFEKEFYDPDTLRNFFRHVVERFPQLVGYYTVLTFCGLRPSEGARVQWHHVNFTTKQLHVVHGKTDARHITMEPVAISWLKWFREHSAKDAPFVPEKNLFNLEKDARAFMAGKWIADGLRHGFASHYTSLKKDFPAVAWYMGNSVQMIKKHYAKSIPVEQLEQFWGLTPEKVLA
jgi:integrase